MAIMNKQNKKIGEIHQSDLEKILDILKANEEFHRSRDKMNSSLHLAKEIRFSPLTSETISARERLENILSLSEVPHL